MKQLKRYLVLIAKALDSVEHERLAYRAHMNKANIVEETDSSNCQWDGKKRVSGKMF